MNSPGGINPRNDGRRRTRCLKPCANVGRAQAARLGSADARSRLVPGGTLMANFKKFVCFSSNCSTSLGRQKERETERGKKGRGGKI